MTTNYECKVCKYSTKYIGNYNKHCNTKKHISKSNEINLNKKVPPKSSQNPPKTLPKINDANYSCDYCYEKFTRSDNLTRHEKKCLKKYIKETEKDTKIKECEKEINHKDELLKRDKELYDKEVKRNEDQKKEIEYYKNILVAAGNMLQSTVSSLTYANDAYCDAPPLKKVKFKQVKQIKDCSDDKLISEIFSAHNNKTLGKYIGDIIVKIYKKEDPTEQSLWNTDTNRLTYLIKKYIYDEESKWMIDKRGVDIDKNIINPILDDVRIMAIKYQADSNFDEDEDNEKILLINTIFVKLISDIDTKKVHKDILKYISSHFYLKSKKMKKCKTITDEI